MLTGAVAAGALVHAWFAVLLAPLQGTYAELADPDSVPWLTTVVIHPAWLWGMPAVAAAIVVALYVKRPRRRGPYVASALLVATTLAATWLLSQTPLRALADADQDRRSPRPGAARAGRPLEVPSTRDGRRQPSVTRGADLQPGLFTQLIGSDVHLNVLGLASIPVMHDLHRPFSGGARVDRRVARGAAVRRADVSLAGARTYPLGLGGVLVNAGFGYALPRKGLGARRARAAVAGGRHGEGRLDRRVSVAIGMFAVAALCLVAIPFAVRYRRWEATDLGEGIRVEPADGRGGGADAIR